MKKIICILFIFAISELFPQEFIPISIFNTGSSISGNDDLYLISSLGNPSFNTISSDKTTLRLGILTLAKHPLPLEISGNNFNQQFSVSEAFPNPSFDKFSIQLNVFSKIKLNIKFFDFLGNDVNNRKNIDYEKGNYNLTFPTDNFNSGIYFIEFNDGYNSIVKKIVVAN